MQFYKIKMTINKINGEEVDSPIKRTDRRHSLDKNLGDTIDIMCKRHQEKILDKGFFFISNSSYGTCDLGLILRDYLNVDDYINNFIQNEKIEVDDLVINETTFRDFYDLLSDAERHDFIRDTDEIINEFELYELVNTSRYEFDYDEKIISIREKESIYLGAKNYFANETFIPELDRIYSGTPKKKIYGHPVDYMIESDDERTQNGLTQLLIQALYDVGRIDNKRFCVLEIYPKKHYSKKTIDALYKTCIGGAVVVNIYENLGDEDDCADGSLYCLEEICQVVKNHCCDVLTIIRLPRECTNLRMKIFENTGDCTFVEIKEEMAADNKAVEYLRKRAKEYGVRTDKALMSGVEKGHGYMAPELNSIFDVWYSKKLKTTIYSQYKDIEGAKSEIKNSTPKGCAYDELEDMIGLDSAKKMIHQALDSYKAQKLFKDKGISNDVICNHMIFTGNPGTAKTSVARLFARILKDNDVISKGQIVEVGRADLVGRYVGWTAQIVKKKFREALGGILFIDEAYSLVDDRDGMYGDEAINTIVQEMENHKDELIVIFAGYPDKMEGFLDKNPGLRSRIAHYVHFEDYNTDELCRIAEYIAGKQNIILDDGAKEKIKIIMDEARRYPDFGNGRYARNVIEKARMAQSSRLVRMNYDDVTTEEVKTICAEDIELDQNRISRKVSRPIGFSL